LQSRQPRVHQASQHSVSIPRRDTPHLRGWSGATTSTSASGFNPPKGVPHLRRGNDGEHRQRRPVSIPRRGTPHLRCTAAFLILYPLHLFQSPEGVRLSSEQKQLIMIGAMLAEFQSPGEMCLTSDGHLCTLHEVSRFVSIPRRGVPVLGHSGTFTYMAEALAFQSPAGVCLSSDNQLLLVYVVLDLFQFPGRVCLSSDLYTYNTFVGAFEFQSPGGVSLTSEEFRFPTKGHV
jgi:hypothetical protein